jgi:hypothetical protein
MNRDARCEKIIQWINSQEGQKALNESYENTKKIVGELVESRKVDAETLYRPFTI